MVFLAILSGTVGDRFIFLQVVRYAYNTLHIKVWSNEASNFYMVEYCEFFPKENLVTMRTHHLFEIINTDREIQILRNEKSNFTFHRAGPLLCDQPTNRSQLSVSIRTVRTTVLPMFRAHFRSLAGRKTRIT